MPFHGTPGYLLDGEAKELYLKRAKEAKLNEKNPNWKGGNVGYHGIHSWVRRRLTKPEFCQRCNKRPPIDLANKSGQYKRDLDDWWWLCRSCHVQLDGRMVRLALITTKGWHRYCKICTKAFWVTPSSLRNSVRLYCSKTCSNKGRYL